MSRNSRTPGLSAFSFPPPTTTTTTPNTSSATTSTSTQAAGSTTPTNPTTTTTSTPPPSSFTRNTLYQNYGTNIRAEQIDALQTQLAVFRALLHNFALLHADQIRRDATFRGEFVRMCRAVGVDPSAGGDGGAAAGKGGGGTTGGGGGWLGLGGLGNLLRGGEGAGARERGVEIAVRVVEVCRGRRGVDGGVTALERVREGVARGEGRGYTVGGEMGVSEREIVKAVESLGPLCSGFAVIAAGERLMVRSVPKELSEDQGRVLEAVEVLGWVTCGLLEDNFGWEAGRAETVCADLVGEGVVWVDEQGENGEREFWGTGGLGGWED